MSRSITKRHECDPIHRESSPSLIVLFQRESLSELVYAQQTQILALRDRRDVVDLTLDSDSEDSAMPVESIAKVPGPVIRDSDCSLIPIDQQLQLSFYKYCVTNQATIPISCV